MLIGVIADTHGYVDPRIAAAFDGVEGIVHAGDVGGMHVLDALRAIAPVHAVYGNNDEKGAVSVTGAAGGALTTGSAAVRGGPLGLRLHEDFTLGGVRFHLVHQLPHARPEDGAQVVVYGHSHRAVVERRDGRLYLNPGAAGRVGFHRAQTVAVLTIADGTIDARIVELGAREPIGRERRRA